MGGGVVKACRPSHICVLPWKMSFFYSKYLNVQLDTETYYDVYLDSANAQSES